MPLSKIAYFITGSEFMIARSKFIIQALAFKLIS